MGVVYLARHLVLGRMVALKMILSGIHASDQSILRFYTEAKAVAVLDHPNIVRVFEIGIHNDLPFFTLEYVRGGSLSEKVRHSPLAARDAAAIVEKIARGVACAHANGILHGDLKPDNILLTETGEPRITDFGLAKRIDEGDGPTISGAIMGSPGYMSPEQASGEAKQLTIHTDIYSTGATLYRVVTGKPPFQAANVMDTLRQIIDRAPVSPRELTADLPRDLETIILKCLQKDPNRRYDSATALADDLRAFLNREPITATPEANGKRTERTVRRSVHTLPTWLFAACFGAAIAAIIVASLFLWYDPDYAAYWDR